MNICLCPMTKELAKQYFQNFIIDPALLMDGQEYHPYVYSDELAEASVDRHHRMGRNYLDQPEIGRV